ncbi:MAG: ABC transporter substrate binding protein, partial [Planctomycetota bacterium]
MIGKWQTWAMALLVAWVVPGPRAAARDAPDVDHVLLIHSYTPDFPWTASQDAGIRRELLAYDPDIVIHSVYMDTKVVAVDEMERYSSHVADTIRIKFGQVDFDGVIVTDNNALNYILSHRADVKNAPVVFTGINAFTPEMIAGQERITGVSENLAMVETIRLALRMHPQTRHIAVVSDEVVSGRIQMQRLAEELANLRKEGYDVIELSGLRWQELAAGLEALPENTIVLHISLFQTADGRRFSWRQGLRFLDEHSRAPIYSAGGWTLGYGPVGGVVTRGLPHGQQAGRMMVRILEGTDPSEIPVQPCLREIWFDANKLSEAGLELDDLPAGATVINRRITFYQRYWRLIWTVATVFGSLVLLLASLSMVILRKRRIQRQLETEQNLLTNVIANVPHLVFWKDTSLIYRGCNENFARFVGFENSEQVIGKTDLDLLDSEDRAHHCMTQDRAVINTGQPILEIEELVPAGDSEVTLVITKVPMRDPAGRVHGVLCLCRDVTRQRMLEQQVQHSQKMEAIGQLAGGIAHDFNNLLAVIQGNIELMQLQLEPDDPNAPLSEEVLTAARRAAELTQQLLNFARKGRMQLGPLDVRKAIEDVTNILSRSIDRSIEIQLDLQAERHVVQGDDSQLHNALLNLGLNARDAMPDGGTLRFSTRLVHRSEEDCRNAASRNMVPGTYLRIDVADTGCGMTESTMRRAFEPFFTTKDVGKGTGLGLASVYGTAVSHNGDIEIDSEPGQGTTVSLLLPLTAAQ